MSDATTDPNAKPLEPARKGIIVLYSKVPCPNCDTLKRRLAAANKPFEVIRIDLPENHEYLAMLKRAGFGSVPQMQLDGQWVTPAQVFDAT